MSEAPLPRGFDWWRQTACYVTGLGMTEKDKEQYLRDQKLRQRAKECAKCEQYRDWMLQYSPTILFLKQQIAKVGGTVDARNIACDTCEGMKSGGFNPRFGVLLCQNKLTSRWHLEDTLAHELVHVYDHCKFQVDWWNLKHHACSEIRASSLSGECRMMNQIVRNKIFKMSLGHQDCVRRRAILSVRANPACKSEDDAVKAVNRVFESCFNDTRPFDDIYR